MLRTIGYGIAWFFILIAAAVGGGIGYLIGSEGSQGLFDGEWQAVAIGIVLGVVGALMAGGWLADGILPARPGRAGGVGINPHRYGTAEYELRELRDDLRPRDRD